MLAPVSTAAGPGSPRLIVSLPLKLVARLPYWSSAVTTKPNWEPAATVLWRLGRDQKLRSRPGVHGEGVLVAPASPVLLTASV